MVYIYKNANAAWFDGIALKKEPVQTYKYDDDGNLVAINQKENTALNNVYASGTSNLIYGNGATVQYEYDIFDRVIGEKYNGVIKYKYTYNGEGVLTRKIEVDSHGNEVNSVSYEYDGLGRLIHSSEHAWEMLSALLMNLGTL